MSCEVSRCQLAMVMSLHDKAAANGPVKARLAAEGYMLGAADHLAHSIGARGAYAIVQRVADELAETAINQEAKG